MITFPISKIRTSRHASPSNSGKRTRPVSSRCISPRLRCSAAAMRRSSSASAASQLPRISAILRCSARGGIFTSIFDNTSVVSLPAPIPVGSTIFNNWGSFANSQYKRYLGRILLLTMMALTSWLNATSRFVMQTGMRLYNMLPRTKIRIVSSGTSLDPFLAPSIVILSSESSIKMECIAFALIQGISPFQYSGCSLEGVPPDIHLPHSLKGRVCHSPFNSLTPADNPPAFPLPRLAARPIPRSPPRPPPGPRPAPARRCPRSAGC